VATESFIFGPLARGAYQAIMCDPPWSFSHFSQKGQAKSAQAHYACAGTAWIKSLPVRDLAAKDCYLWLWATNPMLQQAFEVLDAWGATFVTSGVWVKTTGSGRLAFGTGYVLRSASEPFLIAKWGKPKPQSRSVRSVIEAQVREHSRKPDLSYRAFMEIAGDVRRADLFARESRFGFEPWGNEVGKFSSKEDGNGEARAA
jgi:N6-adenosine-specific RNA methylase IME4